LKLAISALIVKASQFRQIEEGGTVIVNVGKILTTVFLVLAVSAQSYGQNQAPPPTPATGPAGEQKAHAGGPRKQLATIIFAGLGGAILGLSTLSFYGRPQDYLANIPIGFAIGIMAGTTLVTYRAATNPQELYGTRPQFEQEFDHSNAMNSAMALRSARPIGLNLDFDF
jgi:hypothetical protein